MGQIAGTGIDVIEVERIERALTRPATGERFRARVFTAEEVAYCQRRRHAAESFAARFAAKEGMMKVLGRSVPWLDVEVVRGDGPPSIRLHGRARTYAEGLGIHRLSLSLSHTAELATAFVVAES